jgi:SAM-dependent methyltransferase
MSQPPGLFDRDLHRRRLTRAAPNYDSADFIKARASEDLALRLAAINRRFSVAADLGARTGGFARALAASEAADKVDMLVQTDLSEAVLARSDGLRVVADEARLPFAEASLDLVVSSLALHWIDDLVGALIQIRRALKPDGLFLGAVIGGASLTELRQCLMEAEIELAGGAGPRVSPLLDAYDGAALMQRAGFALPVVDVDRIAVRYDHLLGLMADLRAMGETNVLVERPRQPLSRRVIARTNELYFERFGTGEGRIGVTFEIVTLTGWAPHPGQQKPLAPGSAKTRLADALGVRERSAGEAAKP